MEVLAFRGMMTKGDTVTEHTETTQAAEPTESDLNAVEYPFNTMSQDWSGEDINYGVYVSWYGGYTEYGLP